MKTNYKKAEGRGADHINGASLGNVPRLGANNDMDMKQREIIQEGGMKKLFNSKVWNRVDTVNSGITYECSSEGKIANIKGKGRPTKYGRSVTFFISQGKYEFTHVGGGEYRTKVFYIGALSEDIKKAEAFLAQLIHMNKTYRKVT